MLQNLVGSAMVLFCLGQKFTIGTTFLYIMSYFRLKNENTILADTTLIGIVAMSCGFCALISIKCQQHFGLKTYIRVLACIDTLCQFISSFCRNDTIFVFTYILIPMITGLGFMYMPIINNIWINHTQQQGKITGRLLGFMGLGQIFFISFGTYYMNPNNLPATIEVKNDDQILKFFDNEVCQKVPSYILIQSFIFLCLEIPGSILICSKNIDDTTINNDVQMEYIDTTINNNSKIEQKSELKQENHKFFEIDNSFNKNEKNKYETVKQCLYSQYFKLIFTSCVLIFISISFLGLNLKQFLLLRVNDDQFVSFIGILSGIFVVVGRIIGGHLYDKYQIIDLLKICLLANLMAAIVLLYLGYTKLIIIVAIMVINFADGGIMIITATSMNLVFGQKLAGKLYAIKGIAFNIALLCMSIIQGIMLKNNKSLDEIYGLLIFIGTFSFYFIVKIDQKYNVIGDQKQQ